MNLHNFVSNPYLIFLNLSRGNLTSIIYNNFSVQTISNLQVLDLSHNLLTFLNVSIFVNLPKLRVLDLSMNVISTILSPASITISQTLMELNLLGLKLSTLNFNNLTSFQHLKNLDVSNGRFTSIGSLSTFRKLENLNLKSELLENFPSDVFKGLNNLQRIKATNYKFCCDQILPKQMSKRNCVSKVNEISSCENLLRSNVYRVFLWSIAFVAIGGKRMLFL